MGNLVIADNYFMFFPQSCRPRPQRLLLTSLKSIETIHGNIESRDNSINIEEITMGITKTLFPTLFPKRPF